MEVYMRHYNNKAFTLVELIVTVAVLAIIAVMAAPSFATSYARQKLESATRELVTKISEARNQAVSLRNTTGVCLSTLSEANCSTVLAINDTYKNRIYTVALENGISVGNNSATNIKFRNNGSIAATTNFALTKNNLSYCINVGITGDTTIKEGACP
nr:GspH/FimT family pseudopilin [Acinetobacter beijerinckii]